MSSYPLIVDYLNIPTGDLTNFGLAPEGSGFGDLVDFPIEESNSFQNKSSAQKCMYGA